MPLPTPERLETERLVLRQRRVDEAATYRRLWTERDPRVPARRRIDADGRPSIKDIEEHLRAEIASPGLKVLAVEVRETGQVIGYCGLFAVDGRPADEPELAYELLVAAHGQGCATEAARAVVTWARAAGYPRLWADVWDWNTASLRVLDKLGFRATGVVEPGPHGDSLQTVLDL
ncbi:Protein N-acetyltransferase, RimJ/RimL family [Nocardioides alpinus]|uniref:N-acetyltransferase n=1 Tax=Nocardioides alpinus TaxID=748909 RepID=A0A1I1A0N4_9ACTN|nr:GNAT family N-acetyltransferase [Nocardioides alpinus]PKH42235.1 N-acetyltransferase [Nocardioides alpinus]SFB30916.1 Protein N-acetyltransferase, RimJ/RimL family [Nocardioides alpinus]